MRTYLIALLVLCFTAALIAPEGAGAAQSLPTLSAGGSGVTVKATPRALQSGSWEFDIVLDTHSQDLKDDLTKTASLVAGGKAHTPAGWKGDPPGGHHRKGVLRFDGIEPGVKEIELRIARPGETKPRSFRWQLK
jgi:hypothetical protein